MTTNDKVLVPRGLSRATITAVLHEVLDEYDERLCAGAFDEIVDRLSAAPQPAEEGPAGWRGEKVGITRCRRCGETADVTIYSANFEPHDSQEPATACCRTKPCEHPGIGPCDMPAQQRSAGVVVDEAIPTGVYYSAENDNFYDADTLQGMGTPFYRRWRLRSDEFPRTGGQDPEQHTS